MTFHILSLILSGILSLSDFVTEHLFSKKLRRSQALISFSAGVAISYIILRMFPEISIYALIDGRKVFLFALFGFVIINLIEQYVYKEIAKMKNKEHYNKGIHVTYFFVYNFLIGIVMVSFAARGLKQTLIFFVPFFLYMVAEMIPQEFTFNNKWSKISYSMAPLLGTLVGIVYFSLTESLFGELVAFLTGTLLYVVIREFLPTDKKEKPVFFALGVIFYTIIIFLSWNFA